MPNKANSFRGAAFASDRLREVLVSMRNVWNMSLDEVSSDGPIDLYVVDADVVMMFMSPLVKHNYGALLRYDGHARMDVGSDLKDFEGRLVEFLGNLIFFQLRSTIPLLLLPDHADDLERILNKVWEKALREIGTWEKIETAITESENNVIETSKDQLASADRAVGEGGKKEHIVEELLGKIFSSLRGEGAVGELFRFDALTSGERLMHLDHMPLQDKNGHTRYLPPPLTETGKYIPSVSRLADRLDREMAKLIGADDKSRRSWIRSDAQALAHLAWLNELFREEQWYVGIGERSSQRQVRKIVLISGSYLLPKVIDTLELEPLKGCVLTPLSFLGHQMMDEYFQRSTILEKPLMDEASQGSQASALINFCDSMRAVLNSAIKTHNLDETTRALKKVHEQQYKLAEKWQGRQLFGEHSRMEAVTAAIASLVASGKSLDSLKNFLEELSVTAWQSFARSVTMLSLKSVSCDHAVLRNIPPVRFMHFDVAKEISGKLYCTGDNARARENANVILDNSTIFKLKREDPSHYTEFVCYALFGLVQRTLRSAEGCAEVAWSIAQEKPMKDELAKYIMGDEALYLLAHIIRLRAQRIENLERAANCIKLALEASSQTSAIDSLSHTEDVRYTAELFSIHCHQRYFECLGPVEHWQLSRIERNQQRLMLTFLEGKNLLEIVNEAVHETEERYILEYVKQQILVNLAQIALFWLYPPERTDDNKIEVYRSSEIDKDFDKCREGINRITQQLFVQCQQLDNDETGLMPKPSILATSVAAVSSSAFLNKRGLDGWIRNHNGKVAAIDGLRYMYLESVYNYCQKAYLNAGDFST